MEQNKGWAANLVGVCPNLHGKKSRKLGFPSPQRANQCDTAGDNRLFCDCHRELLAFFEVEDIDAVFILG
jgi:hypothetical protein